MGLKGCGNIACASAPCDALACNPRGQDKVGFVAPVCGHLANAQELADGAIECPSNIVL